MDKLKSLVNKINSEKLVHDNDYDGIVSFEEIWDSIGVDQELEDAFAKLMSSHSQIGTVKESFTKLTLGHIRNVEKWQLNTESAKESNDSINEINEIKEKISQTFDIVEAKMYLATATELLQKTNENTEIEGRLFSHWNDLYKCLSDVNVCSRDYIMELSTQLSDLGNRLEVALEVYKRREEEIMRNAEKTLESKISERFKIYRLGKLKGIQKKVREKHEEETNEKLREFREENNKLADEKKAMDSLRTEVSKLRIELSAQPLIRHKKISILEGKLLEKETTATLLDARLTRIQELEEKRKIERREHFVNERIHNDHGGKKASKSQTRSKNNYEHSSLAS